MAGLQPFAARRLPCPHLAQPLHIIRIRCCSSDKPVCYRRAAHCSAKSIGKVLQGWLGWPAPAAPDDTLGVVIVDHGSRREQSNEMLVEFAQLYAETSRQRIVEVAHMEIAEPTIAQAVGKCVDRGATRVVVAPYFLSKGRHIQTDIPSIVDDARAQFPAVAISIAEPIGVPSCLPSLLGVRPLLRRTIASVAPSAWCCSRPQCMVLFPACKA